MLISKKLDYLYSHCCQCSPVGWHDSGLYCGINGMPYNNNWLVMNIIRGKRRRERGREEGRGGIETKGKGKEGRSKKITGYKFPNLLHVHCTFHKN